MYKFFHIYNSCIKTFLTIYTYIFIILYNNLYLIMQRQLLTSKSNLTDFKTLLYLPSLFNTIFTCCFFHKSIYIYIYSTSLLFSIISIQFLILEFQSFRNFKSKGLDMVSILISIA